jgi:hypothetical protein
MAHFQSESGFGDAFFESCTIIFTSLVRSGGMGTGNWTQGMWALDKKARARLVFLKDEFGWSLFSG